MTHIIVLAHIVQQNDADQEFHVADARERQGEECDCNLVGEFRVAAFALTLVVLQPLFQRNQCVVETSTNKLAAENQYLFFEFVHVLLLCLIPTLT
ncbi:hypothetical protein D3C86_1540880 [compost metagenome]